MRIRSILTPVKDLTVLSTEDTAKKAVDLMEAEGFLSLPVVEGKTFIGFLSRQFIYETYFKEKQTDFEEFLSRPVKAFIHNRIDVVKENILIEEAADIFFNNKVRFIPVVNDQDEFIGIITQKALFGVITKIYGLNDTKISIVTDDFKGTLAKITETISKHGGNITNIVHLDTEVMGLREISIRLTAEDTDLIVKKIEEKGFKVKEYIK